MIGRRRFLTNAGVIAAAATAAITVLRDLRKLATAVVREESAKTPMARKVHASFTKFQALVGPWDHVAEGAYHQLVSG
jgi:TRAP-type mannitol/chloroaromatic compound transport system substrate-binding protein